jgi:3-demethoxyubiquinol 3-hydroxylase
MLLIMQRYDANRRRQMPDRVRIMTQSTLLDPLISAVDRALRAVLAPAQASRPSPAQGLTPVPDLTDAQRQQSAALMRVNHAGEVAAQALYHGQALTSRSESTRELLLQAAREEEDHLAWCEQRLKQLDSQPSRLNPLWYAGSFAIGVVAGALGDRASLGFVSETERQVERHIDSHLNRIAIEDTLSRAVLETMRNDEISHGSKARNAGAVELPTPVRELMRHTARVMTRTAYWF